MVRGPFESSAALAAVTKDFVCLLGHRQTTPEAWDVAWPRYVPQYFWTPTYIFTTPEGRMLEEDYTWQTMHRMVSDKSLADVLGKARAAVPKIVPCDAWRRARALLDQAQAASAFGRTDEASKLLDRLIAADEAPFLTALATRRRDAIRAQELAAAEEVKLGKSATAAVLAKIAAALREGRWLSALEAAEPLAGDAKAPAAYAELRRTIAAICDCFSPNRIRLSTWRADGPYGCYFQIGAGFRCDVPWVENLTVQHYALTSAGRVFAGYQTFDNAAGGYLLEHAAYLPYYCLKGQPGSSGSGAEEAQDARFEVYAGRRLVASGALKEKAEPRWWEAESVEPLEFVESLSWTWGAGSLEKPVAEGVVFGRGQARAPFSPARDPAQTLDARVGFIFESLQQPRKYETGSGRHEYQGLMGMGEEAVGPLVKIMKGATGEKALSCAGFLCEMGAPQAVPALMALLESGDAALRVKLLPRLQRFGDRGVVPAAPIARLLEDARPEVRKAAAQALGYLLDASALEPLVRAFDKETDDGARAELIAAITRTTVHDFALDARKPAQEQAEALARLKDWLKSAGKAKRAEWIRAAFREAEYQVADAAAKAADGKKAEEPWLKATWDHRWWIAYAALRQLAEVGGPDAVAALLEALQRVTRADLRHAATLGLLEAAEPTDLAEMLTAARADQGLVGYLAPILERLTGCYTITDRDKEQTYLNNWEQWLDANRSRLYRPAGALRFRLREKPKP
jgi:hypothetical protein